MKLRANQGENSERRKRPSPLPDTGDPGGGAKEKRRRASEGDIVPLARGRVIGGKYKLERTLARGGMGSVWVARHLRLDAELAIKFMDSSLAASAEARSRFEREARAVALLHGSNVVEIHDYGVEGTTPYIVMELLEGEDLSTRLQRVGRISPHDAVPIVSQIARALRRSHEAGIVHRDLKPGNIFLVRADDDEEVVKVLDFGVAKAPRLGVEGDVTKSGTLVGSPRYMSPEQARGMKEIDHRSDLWSLAVIIFRMLTGSLPFPGQELGDVIFKICSEPIPLPSSIVPDLDPDVDAFLLRALDRDPDKRFQSARELARAFAVAVGEPPPGSTSKLSLPRITFAPPLPAPRRVIDSTPDAPAPSLAVHARTVEEPPEGGAALLERERKDSTTRPSRPGARSKDRDAPAAGESVAEGSSPSGRRAASRLSWSGTLPSVRARSDTAWTRMRKARAPWIVAALMVAGALGAFVLLQYVRAPEHAIPRPDHDAAASGPETRSAGAGPSIAPAPIAIEPPPASPPAEGPAAVATPSIVAAPEPEISAATTSVTPWTKSGEKAPATPSIKAPPGKKSPPRAAPAGAPSTKKKSPILGI